MAGGARQSLGPARVRSSNIGTGEAAPTNPEGRSVSRQSLEPRESLNRRSSAYGKGLVAGIAGGKDPRPIRDKAFQLEIIKNLINFLVRAGFPYPISQKILTAPSAKDFQNIFKFLYAQLDPTYDFGKKFEEEVPILMKGLRYPFAGDLSKSQLYAVGSMHAWPGLLAMLGWMVDLINSCDVLNAQIDGSLNDAANMMSDIDSGSQDSSPEKIFFDYLCRSYKLFLAGNDNFDDLIGELSANFERRNEATVNRVRELSASISDLESQYQALIGEESPLNKAQREHGIYAGDIEKFQKFIGHLEVKKTKFEEAINATEGEVISLERELEALEIQKASLQAEVDAQPISYEDIDKMNAEKEALVKLIEDLNGKKTEISNSLWERELLVQKKLDAVEKLIQEYNSSGEKLAVIPMEAANARGQSLELHFNPNALSADQLVNLDLKSQIHPILSNIRDECHQATTQAQDQLLQLQESLDKLNEMCNDKLEELRATEKKIERMIQSYLEEKEQYGLENKKAEEELEQLDQTIQKIRSDVAMQSLQSQQRLQRATVDYDQLVTAVAMETERVGTEMYKLLEDLINFKSHVENSLESLESAYKREEAEAK